MQTSDRALVPAIRCTAVKRDGGPCGRWALRGGTVCQVHGGKLPSVKKAARDNVEAARESILGLVPKAVRRLEDMMEAESESVVLAAVKEVLGQAGLVIVRKSESKQEVAVHPQEASLDEVLKALIDARAKELGGEVLEAEVVEDEGEGEE